MYNLTKENDQLIASYKINDKKLNAEMISLTNLCEHYDIYKDASKDYKCFGKNEKNEYFILLVLKLLDNYKENLDQFLA